MSLQKFEAALEETDEIEITVIGRRSGREIAIPVWFVREGERLFLLPIEGSDTEWFRNVLETPTLRIHANGVEWRGAVQPIRDPETVRSVTEKFREKYGAGEVEKYYSKLDVAVEVPLAGETR